MESLVAAAFVLLIACVPVAPLMLFAKGYRLRWCAALFAALVVLYLLPLGWISGLGAMAVALWIDDAARAPAPVEPPKLELVSSRD